MYQFGEASPVETYEVTMARCNSLVLKIRQEQKKELGHYSPQ
jgi:hypothetical protein